MAGAALGLLTGLFTSVRPGADGHPYAKAGGLAAILWVVGVGTRFAFQLYASHGGAPAIARFSAHHAITSVTAWTAALILMAFAEVISRTLVLGVRGWSAGAFRPAPGPGMMVRSDRPSSTDPMACGPACGRYQHNLVWLGPGGLGRHR